MGGEGKLANFFDGHQLDEDRALRKLFPQLIRTLKSKMAQYLKITEKVSFNFASEASYVYILDGLKMPRVTRQVKNRTKLGGKCQNWKNSDETFRMILKHCAYIDTNFKFNFEYLKTVRNGKPDFIPWL